MISELKRQLKRQLNGDEGRRRHVYRDHLGFFTIGIGRLVDSRKKGSGLRDSEMDFMLMNDIEDRVNELTRRLPWIQNLDDARKGVLLNMSFQMGVEGLLEFKRTLALVEAGEYDKAADQMLLSLWARQTPERAKRMSDQMRHGEWQYAEGT